jgi:uncharacterized BrkB/YihY/UPF0761 family membrane protein
MNNLKPIWQLRIYLYTTVTLHVISACCLYYSIISEHSLTILGAIPAMVFTYITWQKLEKLFQKYVKK